MDPARLALVIGVPALAGLALFAWLWRLRTRDDPGTSARAVVMLLGLAFTGAGPVLEKLGFPPAQARDYWPVLGLLAMVAGLIACARPSGRGVLGACVLIGLLGAWLIARPLARDNAGDSWTMARWAGELAGVALVIGACVWGLTRAGLRPGFAAALSVLVVPVAVSVLLVTGFFWIGLGVLAGVPAAALGGGVLVSLVRPRLMLGAGAGTFVGIVAPLLLWHGHLQTDTPWAPLYAGLVALAALGAGVTATGHWSVRLGAVTLPLVVAAGLAIGSRGG